MRNPHTQPPHGRHPHRRSVLGMGVAAATTMLPGVTRAERRGGTLIVAADTEPRNLNPGMVASNGVFFVASKVIEPLAEMGSRPGELVPRLATGWEAAPDGRSLRFALREGVRFHDGQPFRAADVAFSAMTLWKGHQNIGRALFRDLEAVETPDDRTAIFRFAVPTPAALILNALPAVSAVLPRHLFEGTDVTRNPANTALVGTGPFRFVEHRPGEFYRLQRNDRYWEPNRPLLDGIIFRVLPDRATIAAAIEAGQLHLAAFNAVPLSDLARIGRVPGVTVHRGGYEGITYQLTVEINHRRPELADPRVRRAILHAIDRERVCRTIFFDTARPALGPVPQFDTTFLAPGLSPPGFDIARAEALLEEAGHRRGADGVRFRVRLLPAPWFEQTRQFGDYLRQALAAVGIEATIVNHDPAAHLRAVYTDHAFDLAIGSPVYRNDPGISTAILYEGGVPKGVPFANQYGYDSPAMNATLARMARAVDPEERRAAAHAFQRLAEQDQPILMVAEFTFTTVARSHVRNVANNPRWATSHWADAWLDG